MKWISILLVLALTSVYANGHKHHHDSDSGSHGYYYQKHYIIIPQDRPVYIREPVYVPFTSPVDYTPYGETLNLENPLYQAPSTHFSGGGSKSPQQLQQEVDILKTQLKLAEQKIQDQEKIQAQQQQQIEALQKNN